MVLCALGAMALLCALPALASAATFTVNTDVDQAAVAGNACNGTEECTLRDAIAKANAEPGADTINFAEIVAGSVIHVDEAALPAITGAVTIDGYEVSGGPTTVPAVELSPIDFGSLEGVPGLKVEATTGTRIEGLAIGGFGIGIEIAGEDGANAVETQICGDYLGTDLSGEIAEPNEFGVLLLGNGAGEQPEATRIGGGDCAGNVISANSRAGVYDTGLETTIAGNRIGIGAPPSGRRLGNGSAGSSESAGIYESAVASKTVIGGTGGDISTGTNLIDFNEGPGVVVEKGSSRVTIRHDSFEENAGKGIEIQAEAPPAPSIDSAFSPAPGETTFTGTVEPTNPGENVELEFFASDDCSKAGEGRTLLGAKLIEDLDAGPNTYEVTLPTTPTTVENGVTATATGEVPATSEFSVCANYKALGRTLEVTTTEDLAGGGCGATCSLREAIEVANATEAEDTIAFGAGAEGTIHLLNGLQVTAPVQIDGTSAPNYEGTPVVEVDGGGTIQYGLWLRGGTAGSTIQGLAVGGFQIGIVLEGDHEKVCGSYLGVETDGITARPNEYGIQVAEGTTGDEVGADCELLGDGNLISGNTVAGIDDHGIEPLIAGNRIGVDSAGLELPNGNGESQSAGIVIEYASSHSTVGQIAMEVPNEIAYNRGPGVLVGRGLSATKISGNSIYANEGPGIKVEVEAPTRPTVTGVEEGAELTIEGEATAVEEEAVAVEFFASATCTAGSQGGQTYLGFEYVHSTGGATPYKVELDQSLPTGEEYVTATATGAGPEAGETSEFSECFHYQAPPPPGEQTFTVDSLEDTPGAAGCVAATTCTLRGAIEAANETAEADTIDFGAGGKGVIEIDGEPLPQIGFPVRIDGTSAPGYSDEPLVELDGTDADNEGPVVGLYVRGGGTVIEGLAIGGFAQGGFPADGIYLEGDGSRVCSSWIGVGLDSAELPNATGIELGEGSRESEIGVGCGAGAPPDVISGNDEWGIEDRGQETEIGGNLIGTSAAGTAEANGAGGIRVDEEAEGTLIGSNGVAAGAPEPNQIAHNGGPGVLVESGASKAQIRGNQIYANAGAAIVIEDEAPARPTVAGVTAESGSTTIEGEVSAGSAGETIGLDFYAAESCDASEGGEARTYLGSEDVFRGASGATLYEATVASALPAGQHYVSVTSTGSASGETSALSQCYLYEPPPPGAQIFTVDNLGDTGGAAGCEDTSAATSCTLRGALEAADATTAQDTIEFAVAGRIDVVGQQLPLVEGPLLIKGSSAPGYVNEPVVELNGTAATNGGSTDTQGLLIETSSGTTEIEGLAVGGFRIGIELGGSATQTSVCGDYLGVERDGETALPNVDGIQVEADTSSAEIGEECLRGDIIAGNEAAGVEDHGHGTLIGNDYIGVNAVGGPLPNGGPGVLIGPEAGDGRIGSLSAEGNSPNVIAFNEGAGVRVEVGQSDESIRGNSIFANGESGIEFGESGPPVPAITGVEAGGSGQIAVTGTASAPDSDSLEIDVFASNACDPSGAGEGEEFLGTREVENNDEPFTVEVPEASSDDRPFITVTASSTFPSVTSEFSQCVRFPPEAEGEPEHHEETPTTTQSGVVSPTLPTATPEGPNPTNGEKVVVKPEEGKVKIKLPGTKKYVTLTELKEIPVGAVIDATNGRVKLTSISPDGTEQTAEFFGGVFKVKQKEGSGLVVLGLLDTTACPAPTKKTSKGKPGKGTSPRAATASSVSARPKPAAAGKLWGSGHGNFRTEGNDGSATVRGTIWLVEDRCDGSTFFKTRRGIVEVRDFIKHKSLPLPAGKTYLAAEE